MTEPSAAPTLATDLDGTLAAGRRRDRERLVVALGSVDGLALVYATGRSVQKARELMEEISLPQPDALIGDAGASIVTCPGFHPVEAIERALEVGWPGPTAIRSRLEGTPGLVEQEVPMTRRVSYHVVDGDVEGAVARARERLADLDAEVVGSAGKYLDVLPGGVDKGRTLLRLLEWWGRPVERTVVAGDTLNDLGLFRIGARGIVVANAEPALKRELGTAPGLYLAEGEGAAGILEGLGHHGILAGPGPEASG
jgi:hydroxymethylpyrimidine pyrophosphatase-like HAD family hydrolase